MIEEKIETLCYRKDAVGIIEAMKAALSDNQTTSDGLPFRTVDFKINSDSIGSDCPFA